MGGLGRGSARIRVALGSLVLVLGLGGCADRTAAPSATDDPRGGTLVLGSITDVDSWNPYLSRQTFAHDLLRRIYPGLARETGDGTGHPDSFVPQLAESWTASADGLRLTFVLRDAEWSDGNPLTAEDVRFSWQAATSPDVPWIAAESKQRIRDVVVEDPHRVTFVFDGRYPFQLADAVEGPIVPAHVFGHVPFAEWTDHDWSQARVASGPFLLADHRAGDEVVLERNPRFWGTAPRLDRVVVRIVPDGANLLTQLRAGELDYLEGLTPRDARSLERDTGLSVLSFERPAYDFIGWNGSRPPFDDPDMRRAMTLAIDREALVDDLLYGFGQVSRGPLLSFWRGADRTPPPWSHDPDEARRLLRERGWATRNPDGSVTDGPTLSFEILTNTGNRLREEMLVKIQQQLAGIGVEVSVRTTEMRALRERAAAGEYDAYLGGWVYSVKDLRPVFGSEYTFPAGANVVFYASDEVDALFDRMEAASSWADLEPLLVRVQERIHEDQPYTFLYETRRLAAHGARVGGVRVDTPADPLAHLERDWLD